MKKLITVFMLILLITGTPSIIFAKENIDVPVSKEITKVLNNEEIQTLLETDNNFKEDYEKYTSIGCNLESVKETTIYEETKYRYSNATGKTVESVYKQTPVKKTIYNSKVTNTISGFNKYFQIILGKGTKYLWIPITYYNLSTDDLAFMLSNGRQDIIQDETYHLKSAYYKEGNKYWLGFEASASNFAITNINIFTDGNRNPHHESNDYEYSVYSKNFNNNAELVRLANIYGKNGSGWQEEFPVYPSNVYMQ